MQQIERLVTGGVIILLVVLNLFSIYKLDALVSGNADRTPDRLPTHNISLLSLYL